MAFYKAKVEERKLKEANQWYVKAKQYFRKKSRNYSELTEAKRNIDSALRIRPKNKKFMNLNYKLLEEELHYYDGNAYIKMAVYDSGLHYETYSGERQRALYVYIKNTSSKAYHVNPNHFTMVGVDNYSYHYDGGTFPAVDLQPGTETKGSLYFPTTSKPKRLVCDNLSAGRISRDFPIRE